MFFTIVSRRKYSTDLNTNESSKCALLIRFFFVDAFGMWQNEKACELFRHYLGSFCVSVSCIICLYLPRFILFERAIKMNVVQTDAKEICRLRDSMWREKYRE